MGGERFPSLLPVLLFLGGFVAHVSHGSVETSPCRQVQELVLQNPHPRSGGKIVVLAGFFRYVCITFGQPSHPTFNVCAL